MAQEIDGSCGYGGVDPTAGGIDPVDGADTTAGVTEVPPKTVVTAAVVGSRSVMVPVAEMAATVVAAWEVKGVSVGGVAPGVAPVGGVALPLATVDTGQSTRARA